MRGFGKPLPRRIIQMPKSSARVGVNGFGVIGKRVAEAITKQKDMKLVGVSDVVGDYRVKLGQNKGFEIYASIPDKLPDMKRSGVEVAGTLEDHLRKIDVIIDCTPAGFGAKNQGPDAQTILPKLNITTMAAKGPFNLGHLHFAMVQLKGEVEKKDVLKALRSAPRLAPVRNSDGVDSMNAVAEMMRDLGRPRADMWEVAYWEDILDVTDSEASLVYQVHNESVVVPENVDAVRALTGLETEGRRSISKTNEALGISSKFL